MFEFKLKPGIFPSTDPLTESQRKNMFLMHRDILSAINQEQSRSLLVTGGTGLGKTSLIDAWIDNLEQRAKTSGRPLVTIRFTPHMPDNVGAQLNYLSGRLKIKGPNTGTNVGWVVSLNPKVKFPPFIKIDFKIEGNRAAQPGAGEYPLDQKALDAREQLVRVASKKSTPLIGKVPIVVVTIEKLSSPEMLGEIRQIFDANAELEADNKIHFLVSGNLNLHRAWWTQRAAEDGLMTQFTDIYLGHVWSLHGFCEQVIDGASVSNKKLLPKFANYLAIESNGKLRQVWELLAELSKNGIEEELLYRTDRFYNLLLKDDSLIQNFAPAMGFSFSQAEYADRLKWCVAMFTKWFTKKWVADERTITEKDAQEIIELLAHILDQPDLRQKLIAVLFQRLSSGGYIKKRGAKFYLLNLKCEICGFKDNRPGKSHCMNCGNPMPIDAEPNPVLSGRICPHCPEVHRKGSKFCPSTGKPLGLPFEPIPRVPPIGHTGTLSKGYILQARYQIERFLGRGGQGSTYLGHDLRLSNRPVAIKEMFMDFTDPNETQEAIQQFQLEAQVLASVDHPNAVHIVDFFEQDNRYYLVMNYVDGANLEELVHTMGKISEKEVKEIGIQVLDVLEELHSHVPPIIFRDIKPSNIILMPKGRAVVIDFGIARVFKHGKRRDTQALGTPLYAAPEQYGVGQTDPRSDIYSLGVTLFHLLTGQLPIATPQRLADNALLIFPDSISPSLVLVLMKAMSIKTTDRYQSAKEMKQALERVQA